jgi:putative flavoprotein involved in K+ transport
MQAGSAGPFRGESVSVVIIGAGQAGLSMSHELSAAGVEHLILEKNKVGIPGEHAGIAFAW